MPDLASHVSVRDIDGIIRTLHGALAAIGAPEAWAEALVDTIRHQLQGSIGVRLSVIDGESAPLTRSSDVEREGLKRGPALRIERAVDERLRFVLLVWYPQAEPPVFNDRDLLARLGMHVENALRVRQRPAGVRGCAGPDGLASATPGALSRGAVWRDLLDGAMSLVPRVTATGTELVLVQVRGASRRALSDEERAVLDLFARGAPSKRIGRELALSQPAVSRSLNRAAAKIGATSTRELLVVVARLFPQEPPSTGLVTPTLTAAEREVLALVRNGLSNAAIARQRVRSNRTVANQLASLLRKTGCESRRALASVWTREARAATV